MAFPPFAPDKKRILFFVRGRGLGHAIPDLAIVEKLIELRKDIEVRFVSYGSGAGAIRQSGTPVIELPLPENGSIPDMSVMAGKLIGALKPHLVVSHEEFAAIPAAAIFDTPALVLTDWFSSTDRYSMGTLRFARRILFLGAQDTFPEPAGLGPKIRYVGSILREFHYSVADRNRARAELGIPADALVVGVFPGSWREEQTPLADVLLEAYNGLSAAPKRLIWVAGADVSRIQPREDLLLFDRHSSIDQLMVASNVAITKTNRKTVFELRHLDIPTIAVTYGLNPPDDFAVASLAGVVRLAGSDLKPAALRQAIERLLADPPPRDVFPSCPVSRCAELVSDALDSCHPS